MPHSRDSRFVRLILFIFFALALAYAVYEARGVLSGPVIHLTDNVRTTSEQYTSIRGRAERITELRLNGQTINVTENGDFNEPFLLALGTNRLILEAQDARGRLAVKTLDIVYIPTAQIPSLPVATSSPMATSTLEESFEGRDILN